MMTITRNALAATLVLAIGSLSGTGMAADTDKLSTDTHAVIIPAATSPSAPRSFMQSLMDRTAPSIVTVSFTIRMKMNFGAEMGGGEPQEMHHEINGVLVQDGIVVVSLTQLNGPAGMFAGMMAGQGMQMEIVPSEFLVVFPDGTELSAELKAKDSDLDLAFIQLTGPRREDFTVSPLDLSVTGAEPEAGDEVILVNRFSRELNYEPICFTTRVSGVIRNPRTLLAIMNTSDAFGSFTASPAFNAEGKLVGIVTFRPSPDNGSVLPTGRGAQPNMNAMMNAIRLFILPVADLVRAVEKAKS
ncbi:MAG: serine protease [Candidatus Hydrogenedentota bacterium]